MTDYSKEMWKPALGYPRYKISNIGRVLDTDTGHCIKPRMHRSGHTTVKLNPGDDAVVLFVHQLVALAFFGDFRRKYHIRHKDKNKTNNHIDNLGLRIGGRKYNLIPNGVMGSSAVAVRIIETGEVFQSVSELARYIKGDYRTVQRVLHGIRKSHKGMTFEYYNGRVAS